MAGTAAWLLAIWTPGGFRFASSGCRTRAISVDAKTSRWFLSTPERIRPVFSRRVMAPSVSELESLVRDADWLVDGLLGTGLTRPVEGAIRTAIDVMNQSNKPILALDVPSGLDVDTGMPLGTAIRSRATATFVAPKLGFPLQVPVLLQARSPLSTLACRAGSSRNSWSE